MENSVGFVNPGGPIGSTNGVISTSVNTNDNSYYLNGKDELSVNYIKQSIEQFGAATYRQDTISDINWGMTVIANSIKLISAILTVMSADNTDR